MWFFILNVFSFDTWFALKVFHPNIHFIRLSFFPLFDRRGYHKKLQRFLNSVCLSSQELEQRIETQKQTLQARDESIKKLLEMLQSKGDGKLYKQNT